MNIHVWIEAELYDQFLDIRELLDYGIDVNLRNEYGETAFAEALKHKAPIEVILAIAERTKDVNEPDDTGKTALHYVVTSCR